MIRAIWPLDECADEHLVPQLCRLVDQADALWRHWERPPVHWFDGAHVTYLMKSSVQRFVESSLATAGLVWH